MILGKWHRRFRWCQRPSPSQSPCRPLPCGMGLLDRSAPPWAAGNRRHPVAQPGPAATPQPFRIRDAEWCCSRVPSRTCRYCPPLHRKHVLPQLRFADHHDAGLCARSISAFKRGRAGAGFARLDAGKPHRGLAGNTQNRAVLIEHRGSPWIALVFPRAAPLASDAAPSYVQDCSLTELSPLITGQLPTCTTKGTHFSTFTRPGSSPKTWRE
jgi:hypothetical protein